MKKNFIFQHVFTNLCETYFLFFSSSLPTFTRKTTETTKKANRICHSTSKKWPALTVNLYATRTLPADWVRKAAVLGERTAAAQNERAHAGGSSG